jgi:hypothetical protein
VRDGLLRRRRAAISRNGLPYAAAKATEAAAPEATEAATAAPRRHSGHAGARVRADATSRPPPFLRPHTRKGASGYSGRSCSTALARRSGMASLGSAGRDRRTTRGRHSP